MPVLTEMRTVRRTDTFCIEFLSAGRPSIWNIPLVTRRQVSTFTTPVVMWLFRIQAYELRWHTGGYIYTALGNHEEVNILEGVVSWTISNLYYFFWVIPWRLTFICRLFGTLCSICIGGVNGVQRMWRWKRQECSETSAYKIQTTGNHSKERIQHSEHGESLKSRIRDLHGNGGY
jgi:hypothetical protein